MLPKVLYNKARKRALEIAKQYSGETKGKIGLAAVPVDISGQISDSLVFFAKETGIRITEVQVKEFLDNLGKQKIIVPHPWGGWMSPPTTDQPDVTMAKELVKRELT